MKTCTKCGVTQPLESFYSDKSRESGKHPWCRTCVLHKRAAWYERNREVNLAYQAEWRAKNAEKKKAGDAAWVARNRERKRAVDAAYRKRNRARIDAQIEAWRKANPERFKDIQRNAKARRRLAEDEQRTGTVRFRDILQRDLGVCGICNAQILDNRIELDHVVPLSLGGAHGPENVQIAHAACNRRKSNLPDFRLPEAA